MKEFIPTWLYIKTHNITGLKYFGKTTNLNPYKYNGSGTYWKNHIKKHGNDISTEIIGYYIDKEDCNIIALFLSWYFNIVKSSDWANLIIEDGLGGRGIKGRKLSEETIQKIQESNRKTSQIKVELGTHSLLKREDGTSIGGDTTKKRIKLGTFHLLKREDGTSVSSDLVASGKHNLLKREDGTSVASDRVSSGNWVSPLKKREDGTSVTSDRYAAGFKSSFSKREDGTSIASDRVKKGTNPFVIKKECPYCQKKFDLGNFAQWHGENCKLKINYTTLVEI